MTHDDEKLAAWEWRGMIALVPVLVFRTNDLTTAALYWVGIVAAWFVAKGLLVGVLGVALGCRVGRSRSRLD